MRRRDLVMLSPIALTSTLLDRSAIAQSRSLPLIESFYSVLTFGAVGDGKTVDTPSINRAIDAIAAVGGGTLVFPAGTYVCFTIHLKSNIELYLSRGCTILAADSPKPGETSGYGGGVYDAAGAAQPWEQFQDYGHNHWNNSLFVGDGISNISIVGPGLIHGRGLSHGTDTIRPGYTSFKAEQPGVGNKAIALRNCRNVLFRDFSILHGGHFAVLATGVDTLTLDNLLIDTDRDGFDIDCCHNVRVSNCTVNSPSDDAICLKSSYALGHIRTTENVTITSCFVTGAYELGSLIAGSWKKSERGRGNGRIKLGTESNGGFRNVAVSNCVLEGSKGLAIETADGGLIEDITISNITMRDTTDVPIFLCLNRRNRGPSESMRPGALRRILFSNIVSHNASTNAASMLLGIPSRVIEDVKLSNCYFDGNEILTGADEYPKTVGEGGVNRRLSMVPENENAYPDPNRYGMTPSSGFFIRNLRNLEMSHIEIVPSDRDLRPAFWLENVQRADFFAITAPNRANFALHNISDFRIAWSRSTADAVLSEVTDRLL
jgi:polygalacturonase